ncbi:hypothetical protein BDV24DRAFT_121941 [Aspergillus arachidicola]|uniref:Uncharacterized protein n=1 Tax=Aspergillus arachidicola TaxID=656916 RepID=A0A5N6YPB0_9EURO|nr:hypothetical protein BDV24DRAFT_121941 [Aspergillus arachidicola]
MQFRWLICENEFVDRLGTLLLDPFPFLLFGFPLRYLILFIALRYLPSGTMVRGPTGTDQQGIYGRRAEIFTSTARYNRVPTRSRHFTVILEFGKFCLLS